MTQARRQTPKRSKTGGERRANARGQVKAKTHGTKSFVSWMGARRTRATELFRNGP